MDHSSTAVYYAIYTTDEIKRLIYLTCMFEY